MGWTQFYTKDWTTAGNIPAVGAGAVLTDNWADIFGNTWSVSANHLIGNTTNTGGDLTRLLGRPIIENKVNCRIVCVLDTNQTGLFNAVLRRVSANNQYQATFDPVNSVLTVTKVISGIRTSVTGSVNFSTAYNAAHTYSLDFSMEGINPTYFNCTVIDINTGIVVASIITEDDEATLQVAAQYAISCRSATGAASNVFLKSTTIYFGSLIAGQPKVIAGSPSSITIDYSTSGMGGVGPFTHELHKSLYDPAFVPSPATLVINPAIFPYTDATLTKTFYKIKTIDSTAAEVVSLCLIYEPWLAPLQLGTIGTSITGPIGGFDPSQEIMLLRHRRNVILTNKGVSGSTTLDWLPGQANYVAAIGAFDAAGVTHVSIQLGTNDAGIGLSPDDYYDNMLAICQAIVATGRKVLVHYPIGTGNEAKLVLFEQYIYKLEQLEIEEGITIGDRLAYAYYTQNQNELRQDRLHPTTPNGRATLERLHAEAIERWLYEPVGELNSELLNEYITIWNNLAGQL